MELQERLKAVRKFSKMTQADFGKALGCSRDTIANYEGGRAVPTDTFLQLVCAKFPINEPWLIDGDGEMFLSGEPGIFAEFAKEYKLTSQEQEVAMYLLNLSEGERASILNHLRSIAAAMDRGKQADAKAAEYHRQLDEALADEKEAAAASSFSGSAKRA